MAWLTLFPQIIRQVGNKKGLGIALPRPFLSKLLYPVGDVVSNGVCLYSSLQQERDNQGVNYKGFDQG